MGVVDTGKARCWVLEPRNPPKISSFLLVGVLVQLQSTHGIWAAPAACFSPQVLLLALRAPHALQLWRAMLGPSDPALARRGGSARAVAVAHTVEAKAVYRTTK